MFAAPIRAQSYSVDWFKIAGGGGTSTNGQYSLSGTIGQPDARGPMTGGNYSLSGGFWSLLTWAGSGTAPTLIEDPQSQTAYPVDYLAFNVVATGTQPLFYQWQMSGTNLADNAHIVGSQSSCLAIAGAQHGDSGEFQVVVSNAFGVVTSAVAELVVFSQGGHTGGGVITLLVPGVSPTSPAYVQVQLGPAAAVQAGAGWRLRGDVAFGTTPNYTRAVVGAGVSIEFAAVSGWDPPARQTNQLTAGVVTIITNEFYTVQPPVLAMDPTQGMVMSGTTGTTYRLEYRTSLSDGQWLPLRTNTLAANLNVILPWPPTNGPAAFYRAVWLP